MRTALIIAALVVSTLTASAGESYEGSWAMTGKDCSEPNDSNVRITNKRYFEHEGDCAIKARQRVGAGWRLSLACEGEGEKWKKSVTVSAFGNGLLLNGSKRVRCKEGMQPPNWPTRQ